jgi:hypothetical protein
LLLVPPAIAVTADVFIAPTAAAAAAALLPPLSLPPLLPPLSPSSPLPLLMIIFPAKNHIITV